MRRTITSQVLAIAALALVFAWAPGCETAGSGGGPGGSGDLSSMQAALISFQSCDEIHDYLTGVAIAEMDDVIAMYEACEATGEWCGWYGYEVAIGTSNRGGWAMDDAASGDGAMPPGAPTGGEGQAGSDGGDGGGGTATPTEPHSDTNTQEEGVDEADIVKTDGDYLYILSGNKLRIVKTSPVTEMGLTGSATLDGSPMELFLSGDRLAVFSSDYRYSDSGYSDGREPPKPGVPTDVGEPMPADNASGAAAGSDDADAGKADGVTAGPVADAVAQLQGQLLKITVFDVSDRANPTVVRETWLEAGYVSSRMVGSQVHIVGRAAPTVPAFDFYSYVDYGDTTSGGGGSTGGRTTTPSDGPDDAPPIAVDGGSAPPMEADAGSSEPEPAYEEKQQALTVDFASMREDFLTALAEADLEDLMPQRVDVVGGQVTTSFLVDCATFYHPSVTMGLDVLAVVSFDLSDDASPFQSTGILGSSNTVYASATTLYVATYMYDYWRWERAAIQGADDATAQQRTAIHAFDIAGAPAYVASGFVKGEVLNQFSISEFDGHLRVATTMRNWNMWGGDVGAPAAGGVATSTGGATSSDREVFPETGEADMAAEDVEPEPVVVQTDEQLDSTDNLITVLRRDGDQLAVVGELGGLGHDDERIFAARFFGDTGYVVTFRQMDPLYVIDVSDPTNPLAVGELQVPGYSSYIHPLGDGHLLTIGRGSTDPNEPTRTDGLKLSVYDVSDKTAPAEVDSLVVPAYSEAEYNHKAFTYYEELGLLAIPIESYWWYEDGQAPLNGLALFAVDAATGVSQVGSISHADLVPDPADSPDGTDCYGHWLPQVRRGVFVGDRVYSISDMGVKANETSGDLAELNAVTFPNDADMWGDYGWGWRECWAGGGTAVEPDGGGDDEGGGGGEVPPEMN